MRLDKRNIETILGLTPTQEGILFHYLFGNNNHQYFEQTCIYLSGTFNPDIFRQAWQHVTERNQMLRATFAWKKIKKPVQLIWKKWDLRSAHIDLSSLSAEDQEARIRTIRSDDREAGFDLENHAFRVTSVRLLDDRFLLMISSHSIIFDGWSFNVILKEFFEAYNRLSAGQKLVQQEKTQFEDYIKWLHAVQPDDGKDFWRDYLLGYEAREMPLKEKFKRDVRYETDVHRLKIDSSLAEAIDGLPGKFGVSVAAFFYTVWGVLLQKLMHENDVVFGTTFSGRSVPLHGVEDVVGNFLNSLPMRFRCDANAPVLSLIRKVSEDIQQKHVYEHTSLFKIKEYSGVKVQGDFFDSLILFENQPASEQPVNSVLRVDSFTFEHSSHYDLTVFIVKAAPGYEIHFSYNKGRFRQSAVEQIASYFETLVTNVLGNIHSAVRNASLLSAAEFEKLVYQFNETQAPYNRGINLKDLLEENLAAFSDRIAVQCNGHRITYAELHARANRLAWNLKDELGDIKNYVGLILDRSVEMIVGVLAVVKAGYAYVPIDATLPVGRMKKMVDGLAIKCILTTDTFEEKTVSLKRECPTINSIYTLGSADKVLGANTIWQAVDESRTEHLPSSDHPQDIAYVIFTSGSTGIPKGVVVQHRPVVNIIEWINKTFAIDKHDTVLCVASLGFDLSVYDIFGTLSQGGVLSVATYEDLASPELLLEKLIRENITVWNSAPAVLQNVIQWNELQKVKRGSKSLRVVMLSGDWIGVTLPQKVKKYFERAGVISLGGATEATIWSNYYIIDEIDPEWNSIPYGKPIQNCTYYILDKDLAPCPVGIVGDLYIGGECLALGYINDVSLTHGKFIDNPFVEGSRMYATGDLARWYADGNMELIGRKDNQIKIRGYRIELGEIESCLRDIPAIEDALAVVNTNESGEKHIWAYYLSRTPFDSGELRRKLAEVLPAYMVPLHLICIDAFPVTANGKVDRKRLPQPEPEKTVAQEPKNFLQTQMTAIWSEVLKIPEDSIGLNSNFFELGGHSLNVTELSSRLATRYDINIQLRDVFMAPTVETLTDIVARYLLKGKRVIRSAEWREYYPLTPSQLRIYALHESTGMRVTYNIAGGARIKGQLNTDRVEAIFRQLVQVHESLRTSFVSIQENLVQRIEEAPGFHLERYDASTGNPDDIIGQFIRPFDLARAPLMRAGVVKIGAQEHYLLIDLHHIIADGYSLKKLMEDFTRLYEGTSVSKSTLRYVDYAMWRQHRSYQRLLEPQKKYWDKNLSRITRLNLPIDFERPAEMDHAGDKVVFTIEAGRVVTLKALASQTQTSLFTVMLSVFNIFLSNICKQDEVIIGTPVMGRSDHELQRVVGMFVNTLVLKNQVPRQKTFLSFLAEVKTNTAEAFNHDDVPFEYIAHTFDKGHSRAHNPVFDVFFEYDNLDLHRMNLAGLDIEIKDDLIRRAKFDLMLEMIEFPSGLKCSFEYRTSLFRRETIEWLKDKFIHLTHLLLENPKCIIGEIDLMGEQNPPVREEVLDFNF